MIAAIRTLRLSAALDEGYGTPFGPVTHRDALLVEVADHDGVVGWGECGGHPGMADAAVCELLAPAILGADPADTELLWNRMWTRLQPWGRRGAAVGALSGIDMALWDLKARRLGCPAGTLFGGVLRRRIPCAASSLSYGDGPEAGRIPRLVDQARALTEAGYRAVAVQLGRNLAHDRALIRALRKALPDAAFTAEAHGSYDFPEASLVGHVLEECGFAVFEEPLSPEQPSLYARLGARLRLPLAAGRTLQTRFDVDHLLASGGVGVAQIDLSWCGGPTEAQRIRAVASAHGVNVSPVGGVTVVGAAAMLHFLASDSRQPGRVDTPPPLLRRLGGVEPLRERLGHLPFADGLADVPDGPGWGIAPDRDAARAFEVSVREVTA